MNDIPASVNLADMVPDTGVQVTDRDKVTGQPFVNNPTIVVPD